MITLEASPRRVLDFDIENRPLSYKGMDFTTADITAIAASFNPRGSIWCGDAVVPGREVMLKEFVIMYNEADMVTGHFIRKHDLPMINGALLEIGMEPLKPKLTSDTCLDLREMKGLFKSQKDLSEMLGLAIAKKEMSQVMWRSANRLEPKGIVELRDRVITDVRQHHELRAVLLERGMLGPPKVWGGGDRGA